MAYSYSNLDTKNIEFFKENRDCLSLKIIKLTGSLRGLKDCNLRFTYPISAISGKNGSGKSTILAMAACAYHNDKKGFKMPNKTNNKTTYYTFSDFFIQSAGEIKPQGIEIRYGYWGKWDHIPEDKLGVIKMQKKNAGKWTKYDKRLHKNVVYLGIGRLVPQHERKVFKTYSRRFHDESELKEWYNEVANCVGEVLGKKYDTYKVQKAGAYSLPIVKESNRTYSGFNMGAGEQALFELFSCIYECSIDKQPALIIIDEIELGLHDEAQKNLIETLKKLCIPKRIQVICTTHSPTVLDALPPEARFYIESNRKDTVITKNITSKYAAGKLAEKNSSELNVFAEDDTANIIIETVLSHEQRLRLNIIPIGSAAAVCRQLASSYRMKAPNSKTGTTNCIAIFDGDQYDKEKFLLKNFLNDLELPNDESKKKAEQWFKERMCMLPGEVWPEKWILTDALNILNDNSDFENGFHISNDRLSSFIEQALLAPKHAEFKKLADLLAFNDVNWIKREIARIVKNGDKTQFAHISALVNSHLTDTTLQK